MRYFSHLATLLVSTAVYSCHRLDTLSIFNMEKHLDRVLDEVTTSPGFIGCVFVDHQGLCLGAKGSASTESAGIIGAIAEQAAKLEPQNRAPVIVLENDTKKCIIQRNGTITGAIYRDV